MSLWTQVLKLAQDHPEYRKYLVPIFRKVASSDLKVDQETIKTSIGTVKHLRIKGHGQRNLSWEEMQEIKDREAGKEALAIEVFPPHNEIVNVHNVRHLWVIPKEALPFGLKEQDGDVVVITK